MPFDNATVRNLARDLAQHAMAGAGRLAARRAEEPRLPAVPLDPLRSGHALWRGQKLQFHRRVLPSRLPLQGRASTIYEVADGRAALIRYSPDLFTFDKVKPPTGDIGFAGFRLHYPLNRPDYFDEICAFLGASYFRAVAKGQGYGLSARGLAIKTADPSGEEFPLFRAFWLERPGRGSDAIVVHALLDSQSAAAAFRFTIRPGRQTMFDTEMALYPRVDIATVGIAPLTSMFLFDANDRTRRRRLSRGGARFERTAAVDRQGRTDLASARQSAGTADQRLHRQRPARLRTDAAWPDSLAITRTWRRTTKTAPRCGSSRSAIGVTASWSWWKSPPIARSTTTSSRSGGRTIR